MESWELGWEPTWPSQGTPRLALGRHPVALRRNRTGERNWGPFLQMKDAGGGPR